MKRFCGDLLAGWRSAWRHPGSTALLVAVLALGIGSATAMFSVLRPVMMQALPYADPGKLVYIWETDVANGELTGGASFPDLADWRLRARTLARFAAYARDNASLSTLGGSPRRVLALNATYDLPSVLGVHPVIGRDFVRVDDAVGAAPVAMLSESLWRGSFGADPAIVGRHLDIDGASTEIIGVMPSGGPWAMRGDIWRPVTPAQANFIDQRGVHGLTVIGRLAPDATVARADEEMRTIASALETEHPKDNVGRSARVVGMHAFLLRDVERPLTMLGVGVGILLLLTCCNAAMLLLAKTAARERELALRSSLGAGRARLLTQLAAQSAAPALLGGICGLALAYAALHLVSALNPLPALIPGRWRIDLPAAAFAVIVSILSAVLAGIVPAWLYSRVVPGRALGNARGSTSVGGESARRILVGAQVAVAIMMLLSLGVLLRSYVNAANIQPGIRSEGLATVSLSLPASTYPMPPLDQYPRWPAVNRFMTALLEQAKAIPGAHSVALTHHAPMAPAWTTTFEVEGRTPSSAHEEIELNAISPGALKTLGIPLLSGRDLESADRADSPPVLLINQAAARKYFPGQNPVGRRIRFWHTWREVVGVVGDVRNDGITRPAEPQLHPPLTQTPFSSLTLSARTNGDPSLLLQPMRDAIWAVAPDAVPYDESSAGQRMEGLLAPQRFAFGLTSMLALLAGLLALSGQIGLIAFEVQNRRSEIAVRVAVGALPYHVLRTILGRSIRATACGMAIGLVVYMLAAPAMNHFVYGTDSRDVLSSISVLLLFLVSSLVGSTVPAWRALRMDPLEALRSE
ncbi:MAG: ABC transporter permease [Rhodanobacteraceae bacterium]